MQPLNAATAQLLAPIAPGSDSELLHIDADETGNFFILSVQQAGIKATWWPASLNRLLSRIHERKQLDGGYWKVGATDTTVAIISQAWPREQLVLTDDAKLVFDYWCATSLQQEQIVQSYANYQLSKQVPEHTLRMNDDPNLRLSPYQQVAAVHALKSEGYALFMEPGTGKTAVVISVIDNASMAQSGMYRAIVVCPSNVRMNWQNEFKKFSTVQGSCTVLRGTQLARLGQIIDAMKAKPGDKYSIVVCSYDVLVQSWDVLQKIQWDLGVLDEIHFIKSHRTKRYEYAIKLRDKCNTRMGLTGTPITNTPLDLYTQFEFLGPGRSGFRSWKAFKNFYAIHQQNEDGFEQLVGLQNMPFMQERLSRQSFIIRKLEALPDLPPKQYHIEEVEMTTKQADVYRRLAQEMAIEIESMLNSSRNEAITVNNVLTKLLRLAQVTSGFLTYDAVYAEDGLTIERARSIEYFDPNPKLDRCVELLKTRPELSKTIIWACWRPDLDAIYKTVQKAGFGVVRFDGSTNERDRIEAERAFNNDPDCRVFVGNPAAGGIGLNLLGYPPGQGDDCDTNCDCIIYYSQNWSPTARSQSEDRPNRRGTRVPTEIIDLCVAQTIDEEIRTRVLSKITTALEVADVQQILRACLTGFVND